MLVAEPEVDTTKAQQQWDEFTKRAGDGLDRVVGKGNKVEEELQAIAKETKKAAEAADEMRNKLSLEDKIGAFGDIKDVVEKTGQSLLGLSAAAVEAVINIGDIAEKGAMIGAPFGPQAALAGAAIGLVVGGLSEWAKSADKARAAQQALIDDATLRAVHAINDQATRLEASAQAWDSYTLAVRRAGGVQVSMVEGAIAAELAALQVESDAKKARLDAYKENISRLEERAKVMGRTNELTNEIIANEQGMLKVQKEIQLFQIDNMTRLSGKLLPEVSKAFEASDKATEEFKDELAKIGKTPGVQDLKANVDKAKTSLSTAEERVRLLKAELAKAPPENEGFFDFIGRLKTQLVDSEVAARGLAEAQGVVLQAQQTLIDGEKKDAEERKRRAKEAEQKRVDAINEETNRLTELLAVAAEAREEMDSMDASGLTSLHDDLPSVTEDIKAATAALKHIDEVLKDLDAGAHRASEGIKVFAEEGARAKEIAQDIGFAFADYLGGQAVDALDSFYDAWANKEKLTQEDRKKRRAEFLRDTGNWLITDGTKHVLAGAATFAAGGPGALAGGTEIGAGLAEIGAGAAMGGVGAFAQRRQGGTGDRRDSSTTARGDASGVTGSDSGTRDLRPIVINFDSTVPATEREAQEVADKLQGILNTRRR